MEVATAKVRHAPSLRWVFLLPGGVIFFGEQHAYIQIHGDKHELDTVYNVPYIPTHLHCYNQAERERALQKRVQELEVIVQLLEERVVAQTRQSFDEMKTRASLIVENNTLKDEMKRLQEGQAARLYGSTNHGRSVTDGRTGQGTATENEDSSDDDDYDDESTKVSGPSSIDEEMSVADRNVAKKPKATKRGIAKGKGPAAKKKKSANKVPWSKLPFDPKIFYTYHCPVQGCTDIFSFRKSLNPPRSKCAQEILERIIITEFLTDSYQSAAEDGHVSDLVEWPNNLFQVQGLFLILSAVYPFWICLTSLTFCSQI